MEHTPRSSSLVENLNSRLRNYFALRRHLGTPYLDLLCFFLNHRRFVRSRRAERQGKSPRELMTGQDHPTGSRCSDSERFNPARPEGRGRSTRPPKISYCDLKYRLAPGISSAEDRAKRTHWPDIQCDPLST